MSEHITVVGNTTGVPERLPSSGRDAVAKFGLACTERRNEDGRWVDGHTSFYSVIAYGALAEHALQSIGRGERVIVVGTLQIKKWENGDRSGATADIKATSMGPDLKFGVTSFTKLAGGSSTYDAPQDRPQDSPQSRPQDWAPSVGAAPDAAPDAAPEPAPQTAPDSAAESELVGAPSGAAGWGAPMPDTTPF